MAEKHKCSTCQLEFPCLTKTNFSNKWNPCSCLKCLIMMNEKKTAFAFYCKKECEEGKKDPSSKILGEESESENEIDSDIEYDGSQPSLDDSSDDEKEKESDQKGNY